MIKHLNKLVRDEIPNIITSKGEKPKTRILDSKSFAEQLNVKLQEEVKEFLEDQSMEELADVFEVIHGILFSRGKTIDELESMRLDKREKRGGFEGRIFLESVES